jgi:predicted PurR-regulated permease PerM
MTYVREDRSLELFAKKTAIVAAFVVILGLLWLVRNIIILVFIASVLAAGIAPAVHRVRVLWRYWFRRNVARGAAVMMVYLPFVVLVVLFALVLVPRFMSDWGELSAQMPLLIEENVLKPLERYVPMTAVREALREREVPQERVFFLVRGAATIVGAAVAVLFMVAYMLIDAHRLRNLILLIYPAESRGERRRMLTRIASKLSSWLAGQILLAAIIGITTFIALVLLQIPYALPLAILAAVGEMIPVIGPILGAVPALLIALLHSSWQFWAVLVFAVVLQKLENLFIAPQVMSRKVNISPLAVFIAFMMGASLLGIVGAIMAIPAAAVVQVTYEEWFVARRERRQDLDRAGTLLRRVD